MELSSNRQIARAAGSVMVAFIISNLIGLIRQILVAKTFGTGADIEAFNVANRVSETIFNLVAGGALASAFIPTLTALLAHKQLHIAARLVSAVFNLLFIVLLITTSLAALFSRQIVQYVLAPGFIGTPYKSALAQELLVVMLPSAIIFSLSGLLMGILNSHQSFFVPALTPSMYQIGMIFGVISLTPSLGIYGLAWGVVIGSLLHLLIQIPFVIKLGLKYVPIFGLRMPEVNEVWRLMLPRLLGVAFVQLNFWINTRIASHLPEGSVTGLIIAFSLMLMPQAAIAQSIAVAALPTLSSQFALKNLNEFRSSLTASIRGVLLLSIPASFGLIILSKPIVQLLYRRGEFDNHSVEIVTWALIWYVAGLVGHCVVEILARAFYAMHDTKTPVLVGVLAMSLNIILSYLFSGLFIYIGWMPHGGLALANSLATFLEMLALFYIMGKKSGSLHFQKIYQAGIQAIIGASVLSISVWMWIFIATKIQLWIMVLLGIVIGFTFYLICLYIFQVPELVIFFNHTFVQKFKNQK